MLIISAITITVPSGQQTGTCKVQFFLFTGQHLPCIWLQVNPYHKYNCRSTFTIQAYTYIASDQPLPCILLQVNLYQVCCCRLTLTMYIAVGQPLPSILLLFNPYHIYCCRSTLAMYIAAVQPLPYMLLQVNPCHQFCCSSTLTICIATSLFLLPISGFKILDGMRQQKKTFCYLISSNTSKPKKVFKSVNLGKDFEEEVK